MSQALSQPGDDPDDDLTTLTDEDVTKLARANGWRPKEQWKRDPDEWVDARTFVARGFEAPALLRRQNQTLANKLEKLEQTTQQIEARRAAETGELRETVVTMTQMMRTAEERAMARARKELKEKQLKAVSEGDTQSYSEADRELEELAKIKLPEIPAAKAPPPATTTPPPQNQLHPAVQKFFADNQWYDPTNTRPDRDVEMMQFADSLHIGFLNVNKDWTMEQNIAAVERELRLRYPEKFRNGLSNSSAQRDARPANNEGDYDNDDNPRRNGSAAVTPSSGNAAPRQQRGRFTFDAMPKESKDAYTRYSKQIESMREQKGNAVAPLTKEEWARTYWEQFQDDGA